MKKTIFVSITDMFDERLLLSSGVVDLLKTRGHEIIVCSPHFYKELLEKDYPGIIFETHPSIGNSILNEALTILWRASQDELLAFVLRRDLKKLRGLRRLLLIPNRIFTDQEKFRLLIKGVDRRVVNRNNPYKHLFMKHKPDLVVTTTDFTLQHRMVTREARRLGVRTIRVIRSWDNITSRGHLFEPPDFFIVWNECNKSELVQLHGISPERIFVCGVPHFDILSHFRRMEKSEGWPDYCSRNGLDQDRRLLYILGSVENSGWMLKDVIELLVQQMKANGLVVPCQLLIRPHPNVINSGKGPGNMEDLRYFQRLSKDVHIEQPKMMLDAQGARMQKEDAFARSENMFFSDLVIHFYSTIALEASALDRPNISIGFDGRNGGNTVRQFEECFHLKPLIETGGVRIAKSGGDLISAVNGYLTQPEKDGEQRQKIVERFIGSNDGMATSRVAEMIHALVM